MKIENIQHLEDEVRIDFDNGEVVFVPKLLFYDFQLKIGASVESQQYLSLLQAKKKHQVQQYVHQLLTHRDLSSYEINHKLSVKFKLSQEDINEVIAPYKDKKIIDDDRYAKEKINQLSLRGYGYAKIVAYFEQKGLPMEEILSYFTDDYPQLEHSAAFAVAQKYIRLKKSTDEKIKKGLYQRLISAGFTSETIHATMNKVGLTIDFPWE